MRYDIQKSLSKLSRYLLVIINVIVGCCSLVGVLLAAYLFGFTVDPFYVAKAIAVFNFILTVFCILLPIRAIIERVEKKKQRMTTTRWSLVVLLILSMAVLLGMRYDWPYILFSDKVGHIIIAIAILITSIIELSEEAIRLMTRIVNPMAIFVLSFFFIIIIGAVLLTFPNSTYQEGNLSMVDALFVSTSATCVTGLCPVDFTDTFTLYGQLVILVLIQVGGLGVITLTSFFALSMMGALPFNSSMMIKDLISENSQNSISSLIVRIIGTTFAIEAVGAVMIFISIGNYPITFFWDKVYFSVFHSISAFCNAGFSNYPGGLGSYTLSNNNLFYYIISALIILGGIGFPVYSNLFKVISIRFHQFMRRFKKMRVKRYVHKWDLNSMIVIRMTIVLLVLSTAYFLIFEWDGMLKGFSVSGKIAQAFFNAVLPRTAGFGSQDITTLRPLTFIILLFLMWVGGAPQSTAGGIKVTTLWIMIKNAYCQARGRERVEIHKREVSSLSVNRAFAAVVLTTFVIAVTYVCLLFTEPGVEPQKLLFEAFSAIGTVGSSMGVTAGLSVPGKLIITVVMFVGRIGIITFLSAFFRQNKKVDYRYPSGHILV